MCEMAEYSATGRAGRAVNNGIAEAMAREGSVGGKGYIVRVRVGRTK